MEDGEANFTNPQVLTSECAMLKEFIGKEQAP